MKISFSLFRRAVDWVYWGANVYVDIKAILRLTYPLKPVIFSIVFKRHIIIKRDTQDPSVFLVRCLRFDFQIIWFLACKCLNQGSHSTWKTYVGQDTKYLSRRYTIIFEQQRKHVGEEYSWKNWKIMIGSGEGVCYIGRNIEKEEERKFMHFSSLHCTLSVQFYASWKPSLSLAASASSCLLRVQIVSGQIKKQITNC